MKTIMLVDRSDDWARIIRNGLPADVRLLWVPSARTADDVYLSSPKVNAVIIGWSEGKPTLNLIDWLHRREFVGPIVAATPEPTTNTLLMAAGCGHRVDRKEETAAVVLRLLEPQPSRSG